MEILCIIAGQRSSGEASHIDLPNNLHPSGIHMASVPLSSCSIVLIHSHGFTRFAGDIRDLQKLNDLQRLR